MSDKTAHIVISDDAIVSRMHNVEFSGFLARNVVGLRSGFAGWLLKNIASAALWPKARRPIRITDPDLASGRDENNPMDLRLVHRLSAKLHGAA